MAVEQFPSTAQVAVFERALDLLHIRGVSVLTGDEFTGFGPTPLREHSRQAEDKHQRQRPDQARSHRLPPAPFPRFTRRTDGPRPNGLVL